MRGKLGSWDADVSLVYGSNEVVYGVEDSLNTSYGAASQTSFDAGAMNYDQFVFNAGIVRAFDVGSLPEADQRRVRHRGAPARVTASKRANPPRTIAAPSSGAPAGSQGFPGFQPEQRTR